MNNFDSLMVAAFDQVVCVKVSGKATFTASTDLRKLVDELWTRGSQRFVFDLSQCTMMDSTFLGTLSGIGLKFANDKDAPRRRSIELFNPNERISETLDGLGVSHLFTICAEDATGAGDFKTVEHTPVPQVDVTRTCLEAHQTLIGINPDNARKFKDVTQFLAEDLKRLETGK
jgi:anti-anti-sigma regulatory factor